MPLVPDILPSQERWLEARHPTADPMPIPGHPPIAALDARSLRVDVQVVASLLKQVLMLKRRFRGKHILLELAILAADNMICCGILVDCGGYML